jgi:hypothetical protein
VTDHCPACAIARELSAHRDMAATDWTPRRAVLNFDVIVARRACPDYQPATTEESADV